MYKIMLRLSLMLLTLGLLVGCGAPSIERYADTEPRLDIGDYFQGQTRAWGMVQDYRGEVQRRFTVLIDGRYDGQTLVLDEAFVFEDGETQRRVWTFERQDATTWIGHTSDVAGPVTARQYGHALHMRYRLPIEIDGRDITFTMDDWMYLQPDRRLINRTAMRKFGLTLGEITLVFEPVDD